MTKEKGTGGSGNGDRHWAGVVGRNVRRERQELGWSQRLLAKELQALGWRIDQNMVSALERNVQYNGAAKVWMTLTVDRVGLLGIALGVDLTVLLKDDTFDV